MTPQSSSISSKFKQPLLLLLFSFLKAQPQLVTLLLQHLQPSHIIIILSYKSSYQYSQILIVSSSYDPRNMFLKLKTLGFCTAN